MRNFFMKILGKKLTSTGKVSEPYIPSPFPEDYAQEAQAVIKAVKELGSDEDEATIDLSNRFYSNTIYWIERHESVDFESFFNLIVAIKENMPSWIDGNGFRLDHELYVEVIQDKNFFLDPENESFLLRIIALGPEADHFLCEILNDLAKELNQSFVDKSLEILLKRSALNDCNHVAGWTEISGNVIAEFIQTNRLSKSQVNQVIKFLQKISKTLEPWQLDTCRFQLAQNSQTPSDYLVELTQDQAIKFGWVKENEDNGEWAEASFSELAQKNLMLRKAIN